MDSEKELGLLAFSALTAISWLVVLWLLGVVYHWPVFLASWFGVHVFLRAIIYGITRR